ncbi:MAG TPA: hypothetical protein VGG01_01970 [Xanthobacteraceae bacterium]|jgi:hypothetical protein
MPLMFVPLIMYASWMDFMTRGFVVTRNGADEPTDDALRIDPRLRA